MQKYTLPGFRLQLVHATVHASDSSTQSSARGSHSSDMTWHAKHSRLQYSHEAATFEWSRYTSDYLKAAFDPGASPFDPIFQALADVSRL